MATLTITQRVNGLGADVSQFVYAGSEVEQIATAVRAAVTDAMPLLVGAENAARYGNVQVAYHVGTDPTPGASGDPGFFELVVCVENLPDEVAYRYISPGAPATAFGEAVLAAIDDAVNGLPNRDAWFAAIGFSDPQTQLGVGSKVTLFA